MLFLSALSCAGVSEIESQGLPQSLHSSATVPSSRVSASPSSLLDLSIPPLLRPLGRLRLSLLRLRCQPATSSGRPERSQTRTVERAASL